jgi:6-phosphogluconolactonase (cycloisomerase 2 family)
VQGLDRAYGVAVGPDGSQAYVASALDDTLTIFTRDVRTGALTWRACLRDARFPAGGCTSVAGLDGARGVAVSADGASIFVAARDGDALAVLRRDRVSGAVTWVGCFRDVESPETGCAKVQGLAGATDVAISADGRSVYAASALDDAVVGFARDPATGALAWQGCVRTVSNTEAGCAHAVGLNGPRAADVSADGRSVYVASRDGDSVVVFHRDTSSGAITWAGCFRDVENSAAGCLPAQGLDNPHGVAQSADGRSVYFSAETDDAIARFARDPASGTLTYAGCVRDVGSAIGGGGCLEAEGLDGSRQVEVSNDGSSVYVAAADDDAIVVFDRDTATGALAWDSCVRDVGRASGGCAIAQGLDGARGVDTSPDGSSLYVAAENDDAVGVFDRETVPAAQRVRLDALRLTRTTFAAATASNPARQPARGTTITYRLSGPATVTIVVEHLREGRRSGAACVRPTAKLAAARSCSRFARTSSLTRSHPNGGSKRVRFSGRAGSQAMPAGSYRLRVTARAGPGNVSAERRASFRIVRAQRRG